MRIHDRPCRGVGYEDPQDAGGDCGRPSAGPARPADAAAPCFHDAANSTRFGSGRLCERIARCTWAADRSPRSYPARIGSSTDSPDQGGPTLTQVRETLAALRTRCESGAPNISNPEFVLDVIERNGSDECTSRIAQLTGSTVSMHALAAAESATGSSVQAPALVVPYADDDDPDGASTVLSLGALVPPAVANDLLGEPAHDSFGLPWSRERTSRILAHEFVHLTQKEDTLPIVGSIYGHDPDAALLEGLTECLACVGRSVNPDGNNYQQACDAILWLLPYTGDPLGVARCLNAATLATRLQCFAEALRVDEKRLRTALDLSAWHVWPPPSENELAALLGELCLRHGSRQSWDTAAALR